MYIAVAKVQLMIEGGGNTTMAIVKVRTNGNYVGLIDSASLSQGSVGEEPHSVILR